MQPRLAKKIVQRVQSGDVNRTSYRQDQVEAAFRVMATPLTPELLKPWTERVAQEDPAEVAARVAANQQRRADNLKRMEATRLARAARIAEAKGRQTYFQSLVGSEPVFETEPVVATPQDVAVAAAREVFQQTMQKGSIPTAVSIEPVTEDAPDYNSLTVPELRALVKKAGLKGYSSMTKSELLAALTTP